MKRCALLLIVVLIMATLLVAMSAHYGQAEQRALRKANRALAHVSIGDDLDRAIARLRKAGFEVGDKYKPIKTGDYWIALLGLRDNTPIPATFEYVTGIPVPFDDPTVTLVLEAKLDGTIRELDVQ
jgi:hypothetical protein